MICPFHSTTPPCSFNHYCLYPFKISSQTIKLLLYFQIFSLSLALSHVYNQTSFARYRFVRYFTTHCMGTLRKFFMPLQYLQVPLLKIFWNFGSNTSENHSINLHWKPYFIITSNAFTVSSSKSSFFHKMFVFLLSTEQTSLFHYSYSFGFHHL